MGRRCHDQRTRSLCGGHGIAGWGIIVVLNAWDVFWRPEITEEDIQHEIKREQEHEHRHG